MKNMKHQPMLEKEKQYKNLLTQNPQKFIIMAFISLFFLSSLLIAINVNPSIIPDEEGHLLYSFHFSNTWGIPDDNDETAEWGWYIKQNPFVYYWINGRIINLLSFVLPKIDQSQIIISLRILNVLYSLGTVLFCYLISNELIHDKWWQLLPVFLLTQTLMFVFLSSGISYDNLANFLSISGIFFLVKVFKKNNFITNSLAWILCISLGTLVKYTVLPLALFMAISWLIFIILNKTEIFPIKAMTTKDLILLLVVILLLIANFLIYGVNLINYQSIRPNCRDILEPEKCEISQFAIGYQQYALEEKLTLIESIKLGYPNPIEYVSNIWIRNMLLRTYGILGHNIYYPVRLINFYQLLFYLIIVLAIIFWKPSSFSISSLFGVIIFYTIVLLIKNYQSELIYGFSHFALQGRYIFPVIGPIYILFTKILKSTPSKYLRWAILIFTIGLFIYGGPLTLILKYDTVFSSWFH